MVIGDVVIGPDSSVWFGAVVRGDVHQIRIGARTNLQDHCVVHVTRDRFATEIGWWVSLVPAHTAAREHPHGFRTFDPALAFPVELHRRVDEVLDEVEKLRGEGCHVYDSDAYLADMRRFVRGEPVRWRDRNSGVCDSPNLYFAILPDGRMAVCCDFRLERELSVAAPDFPERYLSDELRGEVHDIAATCSGCLFGSFPEITISARHLQPLVKRALFFGRPQPSRRLVPVTEGSLRDLAARIRASRGGGASSARPGAA